MSVTRTTPQVGGIANRVSIKSNLPGIAFGPRRRSSGEGPLASQFLATVMASMAASAIVQSASTKQRSRSFRVTKCGALRKQSRSMFRFPQAAASASRRAFSRTHIDRSDDNAPTTMNDGLGRRRVSKVAGSTEIRCKCMARIGPSLPFPGSALGECVFFQLHGHRFQYIKPIRQESNMMPMSYWPPSLILKNSNLFLSFQMFGLSVAERVVCVPPRYSTRSSRSTRMLLEMSLSKVSYHEREGKFV